MNKKKQALKVFGILLLFTLVFKSHAQEETLQQDFDAIMEKYSNYQQYKVVPVTVLNEFWEGIDDSLKFKDRNIRNLNGKIVALEAMIDSLESDLANIKGQLQVSEEMNDEIAFVGIPFDKTVYHIMVWGFIIVVVVLAIIIYFMYARSNGLTSRFKKDLEHLRKDYDAHRDKSREAQVRLKRDLQTAVNTIEEMKRGGTRR